MNKISFKGSNAIILGLVSRFFDPEAQASPSSEAIRTAYADSLALIAGERSIELLSLELLFDYLVAHGAAKAEFDRLTGDRIEELVQLARDVETLRRYRRDGTITGVRVIDELPF